MKTQNLLIIIFCFFVSNACTKGDSINKGVEPASEEASNETESEQEGTNEESEEEEQNDEGSEQEEIEENSGQEENEDFDSSEYLYFVSGKINGEEFLYGQKVDDEKLNFQLVTNSPLEDATCAYSRDQGVDYKISYSSTVYPSFEHEGEKPSFSIDFNRFYRCSDAQSSSEVFNSLFSVDSYEYAADDEPSGTMKQIGMWYTPKATGSTSYTSYDMEQSNSTFNITVSESNNSFFAYLQNVEGEFSVTLQNIGDSSDTIEITEGKFKITVFK